MLTPTSQKPLYNDLLLDTSCVEVIIICICYAVQRANPPPLPILKVREHRMAIICIDLYNLYF